ncbi:MAG TPA: glycine--tRNA ligase subunit beta [Rugosibacter sp.]|nr:glycine--tRNA ligase subunit beta [Rugosibacter sp.]HQN47381.1 glycine--tRNA ligase subunit beta [Rugosibacter sp.]
MNATLLIELLTEELPPKSLTKLGLSFLEQMQKSLAEAGFIAADNAGQYFATPRRLALEFKDCLETQPDRTIEKKGPAVSAGVGADGTATKALEGFMRGAGVTFSQLEKVSDGKTEYFAIRLHKPGEHLDAVLGQLVEAALKKLPVAKLMRWGSSEVQFVRPVHGLVLLHGTRVVPGAALGLTSGNTTRGHRFMSAGEITLSNADDYAATLEKQGRVMVSFEQRREKIRAQLNAAAGQRTWLQDEALLDEVTALVEYPAVYEAGFEAEFLAVPQECLILTMKANQKYFPLMDSAAADAKLTNRFLVVSNMQVADPSHIITGNARVVRPRLADAKFFFETDKKTPLFARIGKLASIVYHNKLGSQGERVDRLIKLSAAIARRLNAAGLPTDIGEAERAALLAKADLVTDMVGEFPELQGIMGRYYAQNDGESATVAAAVEAHYRPRFNGDTLPQGTVAATVALADKLDALVGFFGIGQIPTGDKDPFGLRRAALGVLRILMETPLPVSLADLIEDAAAGFAPALLTHECRITSAEFFRERLRNLLRDAGHEPNAVDAVLAQNPTRMDEVPHRLAAVRAFALLPEAAALAAANKRIVNILKKSTEQISGEVNPALLHEAAEKILFAEVEKLAPMIEAQMTTGDYTTALKTLANVRSAVDAFFADVMVNAEDAAIRANRLALLARLAGLMNCVADISRLSS